MPRRKIDPTPIVSPPKQGPRARTFRLLLGVAMEIMRDGHIPSVAEVAVKAEVSRATAYRYFPTRSKLITAVVDESLGPVRSWQSTEPDGRTRIKDLFETNFPRMQAFEPQLRAALQLSLEHWSKERAGLLEEEPYRRGHRTRILDHAMQPLAQKVDARTVDRLKKALSIVFGIEANVILKDIWGCTDRESIAIVRWMVDAMLDAALEGDAGQARRRTRETPRRAGRSG